MNCRKLRQGIQMLESTLKEIGLIESISCAKLSQRIQMLASTLKQIDRIEYDSCQDWSHPRY